MEVRRPSGRGRSHGCVFSVREGTVPLQRGGWLPEVSLKLEEGRTGSVRPWWVIQ